MSLRRLVLLVITLAGMALTGALGRWQLSRADEKQAMLAAAQAAERLPDADVGALLAASSPAQAAALMHRSIALRGRWLAMAPHLVLHPLGDPAGGLTQVELRALHELGRGAGAARVTVWQGPPLTDDEVRSGRYPASGKVLAA